jgi:hypothetical protein
MKNKQLDDNYLIQILLQPKKYATAIHLLKNIGLEHCCPTLGQFHQHSFLYEGFAQSFFVLEVKVKFFTGARNWRNCAHKMLVKLTPCRTSPHTTTNFLKVATKTFSRN